jgi:Xaa-Pro aminopeptidase
MIEERMLWRGQYAAEVEEPLVYRRRRERVRHSLEGGVALLFGGDDERDYGGLGVFRQDPTFFYLTGVELPGAVLMLEPSGETLFLPERRPSVEAWFGPRLGPGEETASRLGFERVLDRDATEVVVDARRRPQPSFAERVAERAAGSVLWLALPPPSASRPLSREQRFAGALRERVASFVLRDLSPLLESMRTIKEAGEVGLLRKAVAASIAALEAAARAALPGEREGAVEGAAFAAVRGAGAEGWAFPPIVGSGFAGSVLHYDANLGTLADGELLVVDCGARHGGYCGDLSRTFPVSGRLSPRQRDLYEAVLAAWQAAVATLRPGSTFAIARTAAFDALESAAVAAADGRTLGGFFIHGIGHFLGLEAHDVGGGERAFAPGMVVTIEPGVYLPEEGIGIRVEDDFLITPTGAENLSAALPRDAGSIERMVLATRG